MADASASIPRVSVLLPIYNAQRYLADAVNSLLDQTFTDFEIVALDDGSTDGSRQILESIAARDPRVRVTSRPNKGLIATLNEGLDLCRGELVARMDADDVCLPDRFERQVRYLDEHPDCVAVGARALMVDPDGMPIMVIHTARTHEELVDQMLTCRGAFCHPVVMMRRADALAINGYDARYIAAEDVDFFLRLGERGRLHNLEDVLIRYRMHLASESMTRRRQQIENSLRAANDARQRMGQLPEEPGTEPIELRRPLTFAEHHCRWSRWALKAGNLATARKHALAAVRCAPFRLNSWRSLKWAIRGY